jgi:hypothetical protein
MNTLFFIKLTVIAVAFSSSFLFWAEPGLSAGKTPPWLALLGVATATAVPVVLVHYAWLFLAGIKQKSRQK